MNKKAYLGSLVGTFIGIIIMSIIGITIYPQIQEITLNMTNTPSFPSNVSGGVDEVFNSSSTILNLIPLMFALGILIFAISLLINTFKGIGGGFEGSSDEEEDKEEDERFTCRKCWSRKNPDNQEHWSGCCDECGLEPLCDDCLVISEAINICKECIDKLAEREKAKDKLKKLNINEKKEVPKVIEKSDENKFEGKSKYD